MMLRPEAFVLGDDALVPASNLVRPVPNRFTHKLVVDEPYWFDRPGHARDPGGVLPAGTPVVLLVEGASRCRVVDGSGLYVEVRCSSLRKLPDA
ncbi:MAG TPA: hypothetical protein VG276_01640 [Actinomycetes bacterium]|jgi:hypothetical protein|nr:hypothetical protein [Actinomycetes bacterium]